MRALGLLVALAALVLAQEAPLQVEKLCLTAEELGLVGVYVASGELPVTVRALVDGHFVYTPVAVEGVMVPAQFLNYTGLAALILPERLEAKSRICIDAVPQRVSYREALQIAARDAATDGELLTVERGGKLYYLLLENRPTVVAVRWPDTTPNATAVNKTTIRQRPRPIEPLGPEPLQSTSSALQAMRGYIKLKVLNFTKLFGVLNLNCATSRDVQLPNGTYVLRIVLTNATSREFYTFNITIFDAQTRQKLNSWRFVAYVDGRQSYYQVAATPTFTYAKPISIDVTVCRSASLTSPTAVTVDGYLVIETYASDHWVQYARLIGRPGTTFSWPNVRPGTYAIIGVVEIPPGHRVGSGSLTADVTLTWCKSDLPPPSYTLNVYWGPHNVASQTAPRGSCNYQNGQYCCVYRFVWSGVGDNLASSLASVAPAGYPVAIGPTPSDSVSYSLTINNFVYRGERRLDLAPPDSRIYSSYVTRGLDVSIYDYNSLVLEKIDIRLDISPAYKALIATLSPAKTGNTQTWELADRFNITVLKTTSEGRLYSQPEAKTYVTDPSVRQWIEYISPVLDFISLVSTALGTISLAVPQAGGPSAALSWVSYAGAYVVNSADSKYSVVAKPDGSRADVIITIGWAEKKKQHSVRYTEFTVQPGAEFKIDRVTIARVNLGITADEWSYKVDSSFRVTERLFYAREPVYMFRNFYCLFNEPATPSFENLCYYNGFR